MPALQLVGGFGEVFVDFLLLGLFAVEGEEDHVVVDLGLEVDGAVPEGVEGFEGFDGEFDFDVEAVVFVGEVEFAGVAVVGVDDVDVGLAHVGEAVEEGLDIGDVLLD